MMMANNIKLEEVSFVESSEVAPVAPEDGDNVTNTNVDGVGSFVGQRTLESARQFVSPGPRE